MLLHTRNVTFKNFMYVPQYSSKTQCLWEKCLEKALQTQHLVTCSSCFMFPSSPSIIQKWVNIQKTENTDYTTNLLLCILFYPSICLKTAEKKSLWAHFLHPNWQACWSMPYNVPKFFVSSTAKVFILFQKSTSWESGFKVSCTG